MSTVKSAIHESLLMYDCPHQVILAGGAATYEMTCIKFVSEAAELFEVILRSKSAEFYYSTLI